MTSEICVMNRLAVVLAADSATTVTQYTKDGEEERYFKGANKVFQLSTKHPVGLMIFDSATILQVPWEVVIKRFRSHLADTSFPTLGEYAKAFFEFLEQDQHLFPMEVQLSDLANSAMLAGFRMLLNLPKDIAAGDVAARRDQNAQEKKAEILAEGLPGCFDADTVAGIQAQLRNRVKEALAPVYTNERPAPNNQDEFADVAILEVLRRPSAFSGQTGLVFAGFGDNDIFPAMAEYASQGMVAGKHVGAEVGKHAIDHSVPAYISAFAQTSMSDTFTRGLSLEIFQTVMAAVGGGLGKVTDAICAALSIPRADIPNIDGILETARSSISDEVLSKTAEAHAFPLRRVLGFLPVAEMADLAETLINLQSLKEKVTKPSETVGGPVDVAVITRNEGLVWIKRKHYFDPALNARYAQRLSSP